MTDQRVTAKRPRVGCVYRAQFAPERLVATAQATEDAGLDELWLWEDCFLAGGISSTVIALSHSTRLTVGLGVLPVPIRNAALTAVEIATLARAFPNRVRIGVGVAQPSFREVRFTCQVRTAAFLAIPLIQGL